MLPTLSTWLTLPVSRPKVKVVMVRTAQATREDCRRVRREAGEGRGREVKEGEMRGRMIQRREVAQHARTQHLV